MTERYRAVDGSFVTIPDVTAVSGAMPVFSIQEFPWISGVMAAQEADFATLRSQSEGANFLYVDRVARAEVLLRQGRARFGPDGAGFLPALNAGDLWDDFWGALAEFAGINLERPTRIGEVWQLRIAEILHRLPQTFRVYVLAQGFFPMPKPPRKSEALFNLVAEALAAPKADLRQWEVGMPKYAALAEVPDDVLIQIATRFLRLTGRMQQFSQHAAIAQADKPPLKQARTRAPGMIPADRDEAVAVLTDVPVAKRHGEGVTQAEVNLFKTQAFHATMRALKPGVPEGHLMHLALASKPNGPTFPALRWEDFAPDAIWPYIATHRDILMRALKDAPFAWEPRLQPIKALKTLKFLPKLPNEFAELVARYAQRGTKAQKTAAAALL